LYFVISTTSFYWLFQVNIQSILVRVSTINGVFFSSLSPPGYFSARRGYCRVPKFGMGF
jgi:hypothetical protein